MTRTPAKRRKSKPLPGCPVCKRAPESCDQRQPSGPCWHVGCSNPSPGGGGLYHHVVIYASTQAEAERVWRKLASPKP